ncbi:MAG TPA: mandelate racemase/muconate lactonizing enzyme family protein [Bryobacteraceae bacterium]|nr:mandelate racemase/muconate lactonizing enzyme family protein [Bryobacteraceae bacterium]
MFRHNRREFIAGSLASALMPSSLQNLIAAVKPVKITGVDVFPIRLPATKEEIDAGRMANYVVCRIDTDAGVRGYSFAGPSPKMLPQVQKALVGFDLFNVEEHIRRGVDAWGGVEHAIWDAIGRIAGQPVYKLLGGNQSTLRVYLTTVWPGNPDQSQVTYDAQAEMALREKKAGFKGMKIRAWRPNPLDDAEACGVIRQAVGPDFAIMFDRTAAAPKAVGQKVWDYETGYRVARAMEKHGAYWLEEPFARDDYESHAKLARSVDIRITGGEGYRGVHSFKESLVARAYDTVQPDAVTAGGIFLCRKIAILAESFHVPCILHGSMGLRAAGFFQASAAIGSDWQELVFVTPPLLPEDTLSPGLQVLKTKTMYKFEDGHVHLPDLPGLGLDVDEDAIEKFRVR